MFRTIIGLTIVFVAYKAYLKPPIPESFDWEDWKAWYYA